MKTLFIALAGVVAMAMPVAAIAQTAEEISAAKDAIWTLEQSIYAGRGKGDLSNYRNNTAPNYMAWPPTMAEPMRVGKLEITQAPGAQRNDQELLKMTFSDFSMNGDTAVIYYTTHRTRLADGSPANDHFDVTHTWIKRDGRWQVFTGMARLAKR